MFAIQAYSLLSYLQVIRKMKVFLAIVLVLAVYTVMAEAQAYDYACLDPRTSKGLYGTICLQECHSTPVPGGYCNDGLRCCSYP